MRRRHPEAMSDQSVISRAQDLSRLDFQPRSRLPSAGRVVVAGVLAAIGSIVADLILVALGKAAFSPGSFGPFHPSAWVPLTLLGVAGATIGWAILVRMSSEPRWFVLRAAVVVTVVLLLPDVGLLPNNPTGPVLTLMAMHLAIAIITTASLLRWAPATGAPRRR
jgi:hypothetical protein